MPRTMPVGARFAANVATPMLVCASGYSCEPRIFPSGLGTLGNASASSLPAETLGKNKAPPCWFQQPRSVLNAHTARAVSPELSYEHPNAPRQLGSIDAAGAASANLAARRSIVLASMPVISCAHSGVHSSRYDAHSSNPMEFASTYSLS